MMLCIILLGGFWVYNDVCLYVMWIWGIDFFVRIILFLEICFCFGISRINDKISCLNVMILCLL